MTTTTRSPALSPREVYRDALLALAAEDERVICLDSDTGGLGESFGRRFPDRYVDVGIAEANLFGVAAGLAARGLRPYVHTMAAFASLRAGEQLKLDIVGNRLPVRVIATHAGLSATHFGPTHYALEDLAVARALQDLTVVVPADAAEIGPALRALHRLPGPAYVRLGRSPTPPVVPRPPEFRLGRAVPLRAGTDVTVLALGPLPVLLALRAAGQLADEGVSCRVLQIHTLCPLDAETVREAARSTRGVVTVEEHRPSGGLGDAVAETLGCHRPVPQVRVAVRGPVGTVVRTHEDALAEAGLSAAAIREAALRVLHIQTS
ncbi:transketolase C-terminal domain-containing protein [Streptomyces sp. SS7]|uniref:transketolase family protein n=1 Tax=Streptomyces sp. SS7 TaxID=3108485 RepID=UPI0030ECE1E7